MQEQERRTRQAECEGRAANMSWLDEKQRLLSAIEGLETQVAVSEDAREKERTSQRPHNRGLYRGRVADDDTSSSTGSVVLVLTEEEVHTFIMSPLLSLLLSYITSYNVPSTATAVPSTVLYHIV